MDISSGFSNSNNGDDQKIKTTDGDNVKLGGSTDDSSKGSSNLDPLASLDLDSFTLPTDGSEELVTNDTISTSDKSNVGDFKSIEDDTPEPEPTPTPEPETEAPEPSPEVDPNDLINDPTYNITDPTKMDFIKTYTSEYDAVVERALNAVQAVLNAIDDTVRNHTDDIVIDESANEFLDTTPVGGRVQKFDEAQEIVRTIMQKGEDAKSQSEQAAREAAKIYDDIQKFKHDTQDEVDSIKSRDEFGRVEGGVNQKYGAINQYMSPVATSATVTPPSNAGNGAMPVVQPAA